MSPLSLGYFFCLFFSLTCESVVVKSTVSRIWTSCLLLWTHFPYLWIRVIMTSTSEDNSRIKWHNERQASRAVVAHNKGRDWHPPPAFLPPPSPSPSLSSSTSSTTSFFVCFIFLVMIQNPEIIKKKIYQFNHIKVKTLDMKKKTSKPINKAYR